MIAKLLNEALLNGKISKAFEIVLKFTATIFKLKDLSFLNSLI